MASWRWVIGASGSAATANAASARRTVASSAFMCVFHMDMARSRAMSSMTVWARLLPGSSIGGANSRGRDNFNMALLLKLPAVYAPG